MNIHNDTSFGCHGFSEPPAENVSNISLVSGDQPAVTVETSEYWLNAREFFRTEVCQINGRENIRVSRFKITGQGERRTGSVLEFAAYRISGVRKMLERLEAQLGGGK